MHKEPSSPSRQRLQPPAQPLGQQCIPWPLPRSQRYLCPVGLRHTLRLILSPSIFLLAEISGAAHQRRRLSLPLHINHQPGMVSSPSIHHTRFPPLSAKIHRESQGIGCLVRLQGGSGGGWRPQVQPAPRGRNRGLP